MKIISQLLAEIDQEIMLEAATEQVDYKLVRYITTQMPHFYNNNRIEKEEGK